MSTPDASEIDSSALSPKLDAQLRRARHLHALATDTARLGSWTYDPADETLLVDARWQALHNLEGVPDQIEGLFGQVEHGHLAALRREVDAVFSGDRNEASVEYETHGGRWLLTRMRRMVGEDAGVVVGTAVEVTAQKRSEREAEERAELQQLLLGVVSHDLKSPLQTIRTALELLGELGPLTDAQRRTSRRAASAEARATRLVWDLLDFARHRLSGEIVVRAADCDVEPVLKELVAAARLRADDDTQVELHCQPGTKAYVDLDRFAQVIVNLIDNALEHGEGARITVRAEQTQDGLHVSVHNPDSRVDDSARDHVFELFEQGEGEASRGMGLGLHIVKLLTEAHGGRATLSSPPGVGTTFTTTWPRRGPEGTSSAA